MLGWRPMRARIVIIPLVLVGDGRAIGRSGPLPRAASGRARFYIDVAALRPVVDDVRRGTGQDLDHSLGMLEDPRVTEENGRRVIVVGSEVLDCRTLRIEAGSAGDACLRTLRVLDGCDG